MKELDDIALIVVMLGGLLGMVIACAVHELPIWWREFLARWKKEPVDDRELVK